MRTLRRRSAFLLATLAFAGAASAQSAGTDVQRSPGKVTATEWIDVAATVTAIDPATRTLTLTGPAGNSTEVVAGPEVKNFAQLKTGDQVELVYFSTLEVELIPEGGQPLVRTEETDGATAPEGDKPGVAAAERVTTIGNVVALDAATQRVTLQGPHRTLTLKIEDKAQFDLIKVGSQIRATVVSAVALSATPGAAPAK